MRWALILGLPYYEVSTCGDVQRDEVREAVPRTTDSREPRRVVPFSLAEPPGFSLGRFRT